MQELGRYKSAGFNRGRSFLVNGLWLLVSALFVASWLPGSRHRVLLLRLFGGRIGRSVVIKPRTRITMPWRLSIGDHSWIGESVFIDNLESVEIGSNCCVSQNVYVCTGNHDWASPEFSLRLQKVKIEDQAWIGASAVIAPGVNVGCGAILTLGSVATCDLDPMTVYVGHPAKPVRKRGPQPEALK